MPSMSKRNKTLSWLVATSGWVSSVLPGLWAAIITSVGGVLLLLLKVFASTEFIGAALIFTLFLWTYIGLVWLSTRKGPDVKALRYGITFEGVVPNFSPANTEGALSFALSIRNYSPSPLQYFVEQFDVYLGTRTLPTRYERDSLKGILSRGAARTSSAIPFRLEHIKEFMGKRVEGTLDFSIKYGDADKMPVRRLKMSLKLFLEFPNIPDFKDVPAQGIIPMVFPCGFNAHIISESDEPIDL